MQYSVHINWHKTNSFAAKSFDRTHEIKLGSGLTLTMSSAPEFLGRPDLANPEELFTAAIASCFMLTFLYWTAVGGFVVDHYEDTVIGQLGKNSEGKLMMTQIELQPKIQFGAPRPSPQQLNDLLTKAESHCFISNSVKTKVVVKTENVA